MRRNVLIGNSIVVTAAWSAVAFAPLVPTRTDYPSLHRRISFVAMKGDDGNIDDDADAFDTTETTDRDDREKVLQSLGLDPRNNDALLEYSIDSFLRGDYDRPFADDAVAPLPGLSPKATVEQAFHALRQLDDPEPSHGAACFLRFCIPLRRGERWSPSTSDQVGTAWKELLRGSLTPTMFARRLRASQDFSTLLDWNKMDVTEGAVTGKEDFAFEDTVAFVNAALYFGGVDEKEKNSSSSSNTNNSTFSETPPPPELLQIKLSRVGGVWLIESVQRIPKSLFQNSVVQDEEIKPIENNQTKPRKHRKTRK